MAAIFALGSGPPARRAIPPELGVYLGWVGTHQGDRLREGARLASELGFKTIRMPLVASVESDFGAGSVCHGGATLAMLATLPLYAEVLRDPEFQNIFLTIWATPTPTTRVADGTLARTSTSKSVISAATSTGVLEIV